MSYNPITKNEDLKIGLWNMPVIPDDAALVLYPHDAKENCSVYLLNDSVDKR